jgi:hypothetical protein
VNYVDSGQIESRVGASPNLVGGDWNDPASWSRDVGISVTDAFPAGTLFMIEVELSYWMKGLGREGEASIGYGMKVHPYLVIDACSYQFPDVITINTRNYR